MLGSDRVRCQAMVARVPVRTVSRNAAAPALIRLVPYARGMCEPDPAPKPSLGAVLSNWRTYDAPVGTKLRMLVSNNLTKVRTRQGCCGNHGQPGC